MKRILFVTTSTGLGGAEKTVALLATGLDRSKFEVAGVVSLKPVGEYGKRLKDAGVRVESIYSGRVPTPGDLLDLRRIIAERKPDIVHAFLYTAIQLCRMAKRTAKVPFTLVTSPRATFSFRGPMLRLFDQMMNGADDLLISECEASREYLVNQMTYDPARVVTILNGLDPELAKPKQNEREQTRAVLGLSDKEFLVGLVGRLHEQKDPDTLLEAVRQVLPSHPELRLVFVGDGPLRQQLGERVMRDGLSDKVFLVGAKPGARPWLAAMDLFALPSRYEGLPNILLEAMAASVPVVAAAVDGTKEVVEDGRNGLLIEPGQPHKLATAIKTLIENPILRARLAQAGQQTIRERFTLERMMRDYERVYSEL